MPRLKEIKGLNAFLHTQTAATVGLAIDEQGTLHVAALLYWHSEDPLKFYFITGKNTEKCRLLKDGGVQKAGCVVGTVKGVEFTLQMRGVVQIVPKEQYAGVIEAYTQKRGDNHDIDNPDYVLLEFTPDWARYTDYSQDWTPHLLDLPSKGSFI